MKKSITYRWLFFIIGMMVMGLGIAFTIKGQRLGVGSWDVLHIGLFKNLGLSIGLWSITTGIIVIIIASIGLRRFPKPGTYLNMILVGLFIDFFNWLLPNPETLLMQSANFLIGIVLFALGAGIYLSTDLGAGPRDSLMIFFVIKFKCSIMVARTALEIKVAIVGFLLGGPIGIGTVIMSFALGPIIQITIGHFRKLLNRISNDSQIVSISS